MSAPGLLLVFTAALLAGAVNSIAGGGTLLTFPALVWLGLPPISANATSTVALWPGSFGSMWAYRRQLEGTRALAAPLHDPERRRRHPRRTAAAAHVGGALRRHRPVPRARGDGAVRAAAAAQPPAGAPRCRGTRRRDRAAAAVGHGSWPAQFGVAVYGGYFGAGIGILMLAALGAMGLSDIHRMNGIKNWGAMCINAVAATTFAVSGIVTWPVAATMAVGGLVGGYGGARLALRVGQKWVRRAVVAIGLLAFLWLLVSR